MLFPKITKNIVEENGERVAEISSDHIKRSVSEIQDAENAENQTQPRSDEEQEHRIG